MLLFCLSFFTLGNTSINTGTIYGTVLTEYGNGVPAEVFAYGLNTYSDITDEEGGYSIENIPTAGGYTVIPVNDDNYLSEVSTFDLVLISKHILGIQALDSPYKILAADTNNSGSVTVADLLALRALMLGIVESLPDNTSWRFIPADFVFPNPQNPWETPIPEIININTEDWTEMELNWIGVKIGNVTG